MAGEKWIQKANLNEGAFTRKAKQHGMTVAEFRQHVLANKDKYDTTTVRQANLAKTFARGFGR